MTSTRHQHPTRLHALPNELLVEIIGRIPDFHSLDNFLLAYPTFGLIISRQHRQIFTRVLETCDQSLQIQRLVLATMTLHDVRPSVRFAMQVRATLHINNDGTSWLVPYFRRPLRTLHYIARMQESVEEYGVSCAARRIARPSIQALRTVSLAELYRIQRGLWRLLFLYELSDWGRGAAVARREAKGTIPTPAERRYFQPKHNHSVSAELSMSKWLVNRSLPPLLHVRRFLATLRDWEIEELEAVRFHVKAEVNRFQYNRVTGAPAGEDLVGKPLLLQRLIGDLDGGIEDDGAPADHVLVGDFVHPLIWIRSGLYAYQSDIPDATKGPSIPREATSAILSQYSFVVIYQHYEQWGWSLWDSARAQNRGIVKRTMMFPDTDKNVQVANQSCYEDQFYDVDIAIRAIFDTDLAIKKRNAQREKERLAGLLGWSMVYGSQR